MNDKLDHFVLEYDHESGTALLAMTEADGGRIAEAGRHDDLVAKGGLYARLWRDYTEARDVVLKPSGQMISEECPS